MSRNDFDFILKVKGSIVLIDYTKYTVDELLDVNENINKDKYPERYKQLCDEIQRRKDRGEFIKRNIRSKIFETMRKMISLSNFHLMVQLSFEQYFLLAFSL